MKYNLTPPIISAAMPVSAATYTAIVIVCGRAGQSKSASGRDSSGGMVADFGEVKTLLKQIADQYDHKLLLEDNADGQAVAQQLSQLPNQFAICMVPYRPTAEEMARAIYYQIKTAGYPVYSVEIFETPVNSCIYREV